MSRSTTISNPVITDITPRRGRPREFDKAEVLRRSMLTFWEKGYHATSIDDLTISTGIQKSSLYAAFGDKASLFLASLDRYTELICSGEMASLQKGSTPSESLHSFFTEVIRAATAAKGPRGCMIVCVLSELASTEQKLQKRLLEIIKDNDQAIADRLRLTGFSGDCEETGKLVSTMVLGYAVRARSGESRANLLATVPSTVNFILKER